MEPLIEQSALKLFEQVCLLYGNTDTSSAKRYCDIKSLIEQSALKLFEQVCQT